MEPDLFFGLVLAAVVLFMVWLGGASAVWEEYPHKGTVRARMLRAIFWPVLAIRWCLRMVWVLIQTVYQALVHNRELE